MVCYEYEDERSLTHVSVDPGGSKVTPVKLKKLDETKLGVQPQRKRHFHKGPEPGGGPGPAGPAGSAGAAGVAGPSGPSGGGEAAADGAGLGTLFAAPLQDVEDLGNDLGESLEGCLTEVLDECLDAAGLEKLKRELEQTIELKDNEHGIEVCPEDGAEDWEALGFDKHVDLPPKEKVLIAHAEAGMEQACADLLHGDVPKEVVDLAKELSKDDSFSHMPSEDLWVEAAKQHSCHNFSRCEKISECPVECDVPDVPLGPSLAAQASFDTDKLFGIWSAKVKEAASALQCKMRLSKKPLGSIANCRW